MKNEGIYTVGCPNIPMSRDRLWKAEGIALDLYEILEQACYNGDTRMSEAKKAAEATFTVLNRIRLQVDKDEGRVVKRPKEWWPASVHFHVMSGPGDGIRLVSIHRPYMPPPYDVYIGTIERDPARTGKQNGYCLMLFTGPQPKESGKGQPRSKYGPVLECISDVEKYTLGHLREIVQQAEVYSTRSVLEFTD